MKSGLTQIILVVQAIPVTFSLEDCEGSRDHVFGAEFLILTIITRLEGLQAGHHLLVEDRFILVDVVDINVEVDTRGLLNRLARLRLTHIFGLKVVLLTDFPSKLPLLETQAAQVVG